VSYPVHVLTLISIYVMLGLSLNLVIGYTGQLSLCHAAFYGIGAYVCSLLMISQGLPFPAAACAAVAFAAASSLLLSVVSMRLRGDYFTLATLGFQLIIFSLLYNWVDVTNGPYGIVGVPRPALFGFALDTNESFLIFSGLAAAACVGLFYLLGHSPFGRALKAVREDELAASALGKNTLRLKRQAFAIAAGVAAFAGALFASYQRYVDPTSFTLMESTFTLSVVIIGGAGNVRGPLWGAALMILMPEGLRLLGIPAAIAPNLRVVIYGLVILLVMRFRPRGLAGEYGF
jgi:branched-chain amino acid transport system permease protein